MGWAAGVLPAERARVVEQLKREGRFVAVAGDGINDAPALATAHVGIAMGTGTDVAMNSAHVTLVKGDLRGSSAPSAALFEAKRARIAMVRVKERQRNNSPISQKVAAERFAAAL